MYNSYNFQGQYLETSTATLSSQHKKGTLKDIGHWRTALPALSSRWYLQLLQSPPTEKHSPSPAPNCLYLDTSAAGWSEDVSLLETSRLLWDSSPTKHDRRVCGWTVTSCQYLDISEAAALPAAPSWSEDTRPAAASQPLLGHLVWTQKVFNSYSLLVHKRIFFLELNIFFSLIFQFLTNDLISPRFSLNSVSKFPSWKPGLPVDWRSLSISLLFANWKIIIFFCLCKPT